MRPFMAQERMSNLSLLNIEEDIVQKIDFTDIIDLFRAAKKKQEKSFKCFFSKDLLAILDFILIFFRPKIILLSFQFEKY